MYAGTEGWHSSLSWKHNLPFEEAMLQFAESSTYDMLFDFDTAVWKEGPDYLLDLYEDEIRSTHSIAM